jgi:DNA primase catalytic core
MTLSPAWLDELRARTPLSTLIGRTIKVTKAGREFKACCPFHNEKTPSFTINDDKGFYHCLAPETRVLTREGCLPIEQLSGSCIEILTRNGRWVNADFAAYGEQRLWKISLARNGVRKEIFATSGHRWFVHDRRMEYTTERLKPGHALEAAMPPKRSDWTLDPEGVRHGIIFGDRTMDQGPCGTLNLRGEKDACLRDWFPGQEHQIRERTSGKLNLRIYGGGDFKSMKQLPDQTCQDGYLLGFLAGYLAADGHVAKDGTVMLRSVNAETLESIRDIACRLGIATFNRTTLVRKGYSATKTALHRIHFVNSTLSAKLFLLLKARERFLADARKFERLRWVVVSVEPSERTETVYCASVPDEHAFALEDNILTGNCFGCGAHGDAIRWMTDQRGLPFMDAVKELAAAAGMDVPAPDPRAADRAEKANSLHDVMTAATEWFIERLQDMDGVEAREYLKKRGLTAATTQTFGIGFAPDSRGKLRAALKSFGDDKLIEAGLLILVDEKEPYDRFRGRIMIPIRDPRGRVIAFGGRILGAGEPKYLNSPDTPLFDKGRTLYNLDRAAAVSRKTNRIIVVEGYMDVIALAQAGIGDAVAPLGTALTEHQIERLWRLSDVPKLCFDGDQAGQKAAIRAALRALPHLQPAKSLAFALLPKGKDPDDVVNEGGARAMETMLDASEPLVDKLWQYEAEAAPLRTPEDRAGFRRRLGEHVQSIQDGNVRSLYQSEFRERFENAFQPAPRERGRFVPGKKPLFERPTSGRARAIGGSGVDPVFARAILSGLLRHPTILLVCGEALSTLAIEDAELDRLRITVLDAAYDGVALETSALIPICDSAGLGGLVQALLNANGLAFSFTRRQADAEIARRDLGMAIEALAARPALDAALAAATARLSEQWDENGFAEQVRLREALGEANRKLANLTQDDDDII